MKKSLVFALTILLCAFSLVFSQKESDSAAPLPKKVEVDPFKLEVGSSFSASSKSQKKQDHDVLAVAFERDNLTADFIDALDIIKNNYVNSKRLNYNELTKSSITSMLRTLDPHSNYYDSNEFQELLDDQRSMYAGIGCTIANYVNNGITDTYITSTYSDSPAFRAGLRFGDKIISVDGEKVTNQSSIYVRERIRGAKGSTVRLTIERSLDKKIQTFEIKRNIVPQPSIADAYLIRPEVGYIELSKGFNYTTFEELNSAFEQLKKQGMSSLILDLRDNPGGIVDQAVKVAGKFLQNGQVIVSQSGRFAIDSRMFKANNKTTENIPLIVLVDENSASASEIVAGALQDHDRALLVGTKTFGKGLVQSVIDLPRGYGLTLTTAKYLTPSGRLIQRDYSSVSNYDYFNHKISSTNSKASKTDTGRLVYSGDGITPDEIVEHPKFSTFELSLIDPIFLFANEMVNGRVKGFEDFKVTTPIQYGHRVRPSDFQIVDGLLNKFQEFLQNQQNIAVSKTQIDEYKNFITSRIRYNLATASFGNVAANQVLIENDLQIAKAINSLPRAQNLALAAQKILKRTTKK